MHVACGPIYILLMHVTIIQMNDKLDGLRLWDPTNYCCENVAPGSPQSLHRFPSSFRYLLQMGADDPAALKVSRRSAQCTWQLNNITILIVNLVVSWIHLHYSISFQGYLRMLLQSLRVLCKTQRGPGGIWKFLEALLKATGVSERLTYTFWTDVHFAHVVLRMLLFDIDSKIITCRKYSCRLAAFQK